MVLRILQWNLNGYLNNYNELKILNNEKSPHIIALQETHLKANPPTSCIPKNFDFYSKNCSSDFAKNGVALLISKNIPHKLVSVSSEFDVVGIEINANITFIILNIYIPPSKSFTLSDLTNILSDINKPVLLLGDLNAWSPQWGSSKFNKRGRTISTFMSDNDLLLLNNKEPTHFSTHNTFTNVDISLCSPSLFTFSSWNVSKTLNGSDHFQIYITLFDTLNVNFKKRTVFKTDVANWDKFQILGSKYVNFDIESNNINHIAARFHRGLIQSANESMPKSSGNFKKKPICWWNPHINNLREQKKEKWKKYKSTGCILLLMEYKRANALFKRETKIAKRTSFVEYTKDINPSTSAKILWHKVKALNSIYQPTTIKYLNSSNNEVIDHPVGIANTLGEVWSNYSNDSNFSNSYINNKNDVINTIFDCNCTSTRAKLIEKPITLIELQSCLNTLKGKTPGSDQINYPMLKNLATNEKVKLCTLYNKIFESGIIPHQWKKATVIPIRKPNKPINSILGYRPISLLSCISKVLEKLIARRLAWVLTHDNRLSTNQTAYKADSGTLDALLVLDDYISNCISTKNHISIISIDAEKAFDRVGVHSVIHQLQQWKFGPKILNYVKSFLINRSFCVRLNNYHSKTFRLENGIPQGSPLSVVLFLIAFNKLSVIINEHKYFQHIIYADDLYIYSTVKNNIIFNDKFNELFCIILEWCQYSGVKISKEKSKHLHICKKINCSNVTINVNSYLLENVNDLRILGLIFDKKYLWTPHINHLSKSLQNRINIITCLSKLNLEPNTKSLLDITNATILSKIDYGLTIYGFTSKRNLSMLKTIYHTAIRRSLGAFRTSPIKNILAEAGVLSIEDRRDLLTGHIIRKISNPKKSKLLEITKKKLKRKRTPKKQSALDKSIDFAKTHHIVLENTPIKKQNNPPWNIRETSLVLNLSTLKKDETNPEIFLAEFQSIVAAHTNYLLIFTDGSKSQHGTGFSIVVQQRHQSNFTQTYLLPQYASVFTAEAEAILTACNYAVSVKMKTLICSDSLSSLTAIENVNCNNPTICIIRDILINNKNIKIIWIPSHIGIRGNEEADQAAKSISTYPLRTLPFFNKKDIKNEVNSIIKTKTLEEWTSYTHIYKTFNPDKSQINFPTTVSRRETIVYTRFRLGHTRLTHKFLFDPTSATDCIFCLNETMSVHHLIQDCPIVFSACLNICTKSPLELLKNNSEENIKNFAKLLRKLNIFFEV